MSEHITLKLPDREIYLSPNSHLIEDCISIFDSFEPSDDYSGNMSSVTDLHENGVCDIYLTSRRILETIKDGNSLFDSNVSLLREGSSYVVLPYSNYELREVIVDTTSIMMKYYSTEMKLLEECLGPELFLISRVGYKNDNQKTIKIKIKMAMSREEVTALGSIIEARKKTLPIRVSFQDYIPIERTYSHNLWNDMILEMHIPIVQLKKSKLLFFRNDFKDFYTKFFGSFIPPSVSITVYA